MSFTTITKLPRSISIIAAARALSICGDEIALIALLFRAKGHLGHWGVAAVLVAGSAPLILMSPLSGLLIDRLRTRYLLIVTNLLQALVCAVLAISGTNEFIPLIALLACATAVVNPAWQALVPALVSSEQLPRATGRLQSAFALAGMIGPFLGGFLYSYLGFRGVIFVDAASFVAMSFVPMFMKADRVPKTREPSERSSDGAFSGFSFIAKLPTLRALVILITFIVLTFGVINVVEIFFATVTLHAGPRGYGLLGLCAGTGMFVAATLTDKISAKFKRTDRVFLVSCLVLIVLLGVFAEVRTIWQAAIVVTFIGAANTVLNIQGSLIMIRSSARAEHLRGRIFAAIQGSVSTAQVASLGLGGVLLSFWSPRTIIVLGALASLGTLTLTAGPLLRAHDSEPESVVQMSSVD